MALKYSTTPSRALYMVFVRPALTAQRLRPLQPCAAPPARPTPSPRPFSSSTALSKIARGRRPPPSAAQAGSAADPRPRNMNIPARSVVLVDSTGKLGEPLPRADVLQRIDPGQDDLVCLQKPPEYMTFETHGQEYEAALGQWEDVVREYRRGKQRLERLKAGDVDQPPVGRGSGRQGRRSGAGGADKGEHDADAEMRRVLKMPGIWWRRDRCIRLPTGEEWIPVCKIVNRGEEKAKEDAARKVKKEAKKWAPEGVKILEFNWATEAGDLGHRIKKVQELLRKRHKVEIVIAPKKRGRAATQEECKSLIARVKEAIAEVDGAKETRDMQGRMGQVVSILAEGKRGKDALEEAQQENNVQ